MNPTEKPITPVPPPQPGRDRAGRTLSLVILLLLALAVCGVAIGTQSFWIDEGGTGFKARQAPLARWWQVMMMGDADVQMPLYFFFTWVWEGLVGLNEFAMRAGNVPWLLLGLITLWRALADTPLLRRGFSLALLSSPFLWYYLNEARPYALQISVSLVVFSALVRISLDRDPPDAERRWVLVLCLGCLLMAASSMLAMIALGAYLGAAVLAAPRDLRRRLALRYWPYWALTLILLFATGLFYLWTMGRGSRSYIGLTDIRNAAFVLFELLGLSGLGPGRVAILAGGLRAFTPWLPWLAVYSALLLVVLVQGWKELATFFSLRARVCWTLCLAAFVGFLLTMGVAIHFRVLGRHCATMLVPILFVVGAGVVGLWKRGTWTARAALGLFLALVIISDLNLRFNQRHAKDDYRTAAAIAGAAVARGEHVWWCADRNAALYYDLSLPERGALPTPGQAILTYYLPDSVLTNQPAPSIVLVSRPDHYDLYGIVQNYLESKHYRVAQTLQGFTVWRKDGSGPGAAPGAK